MEIKCNACKDSGMIYIDSLLCDCACEEGEQFARQMAELDYEQDEFDKREDK